MTHSFPTRRSSDLGVGWGGAVRGLFVRRFLIVVGRKPVVLRPHEGFEKEPGAARHKPEELPVRFGDGFRALGENAADPNRNFGRDKPDRKSTRLNSSH